MFKGDFQNHQQKTWSPNAHQKRSIDQQMRQCHEVLQSQVKAQNRFLVQEVFSPPRFTTVAQQHGFTSNDIKSGYDLTTAADRKRVEAALESNPPELLVLCPPCTDEGGWFHPNSTKMGKAGIPPKGCQKS